MSTLVYAILAVFLLVSAEANAFSCPKRGTVVEYDSDGRNTATWQGADPEDPSVCIRDNPLGARQSLLFNYFGVQTGRNLDDARRPMNDLLSHAVDHVQFVVKLKKSGGGVMGDDTYDETWTRIGSENVTVGALTIRAEVFEREEQGRWGNYFHGKWKIWYDPQTGIFLKSVFTPISGTANGQNYRVFKITTP